MNSADIETELAELKAKKREQIAAGASQKELRETLLAISDREERLPVLRELEAKAQQDAHWAAIEALRPEARAAIEAAKRATVLAPLYAAVERAIGDICAELKKLPEYRAELERAKTRAIELTRRAELPFTNEQAREQDIREDIGAIVHRVVWEADLHPAVAHHVPAAFPFVDRSALGRPAHLKVVSA